MQQLQQEQVQFLENISYCALLATCSNQRECPAKARFGAESRGNAGSKPNSKGKAGCSRAQQIPIIPSMYWKLLLQSTVSSMSVKQWLEIATGFIMLFKALPSGRSSTRPLTACQCISYAKPNSLRQALAAFDSLVRSMILARFSSGKCDNHYSKI